MKNLIKTLGIAGITALSFLPMKNASGQDTLSYEQKTSYPYEAYFLEEMNNPIKKEIVSDEKRYEKVLSLGKTLNSIKDQQIYYMKLAQEISGFYYNGEWLNEGKEEYFLNKADSLEKISKILEVIYNTEKNLIIQKRY